MTVRKTIQPEVTMGLNLGAEERELVFDLAFVEEEILQRIRQMPVAVVQVQLTVDQLGSLAGSIAADINHTGDKARQAKLARIYENIDILLRSHADSESTTRSEAVKLAQFAASVLVLADRYAEGGVVGPGSIGRTHKIGLKLTKSERAVILGLPRLREPVKSQIDVASNGPRTFQLTVSDLATICFGISEAMLAASEAMLGAQVRDTVKPMRLAGKLSLILADYIVANADSRIKQPSPKPRSARSKNTLYQLRIALKDIQPAIWRRIQVKDCSLVVLHKIIQVAMGWENYHLYSFETGGKEYGDPALIDDDLEMEDARTAWLSDIVPEDGKRFRFDYTYDFGDGWKHEVLFEGCPRAEKGLRFPLCLEGERACPPEDSGGASGYEEYLEAMTDPEDEQHEDLLTWRGPFDPERFDLESVNRALRRVRK